MRARIEAYQSHHRQAVVDLSLRAWAPVFVSIENAMDAEVYRHFYPDWRVTQAKAVGEVCDSPDMDVSIALDNGKVAGFVALRYHKDDRMGEIYMIAVDPDFQRRGIGVELTQFALHEMKQAGMAVAMVETGADPGHAPARQVYEAAGFRNLPAARYFRKI